MQLQRRLKGDLTMSMKHPTKKLIETNQEIKWYETGWFDGYFSALIDIKIIINKKIEKMEKVMGIKNEVS